jgi:hypothetical protein
MLQYPDGRNDGKPCDIYWHNVCYHDMRTIVTNSTSRVNKFPGTYSVSIYKLVQNVFQV